MLLYSSIQIVDYPVKWNTINQKDAGGNIEFSRIVCIFPKSSENVKDFLGLESLLSFVMLFFLGLFLYILFLYIFVLNEVEVEVEAKPLIVVSPRHKIFYVALFNPC